MAYPQLQSQRQIYRLWFEFLKMAHREPDLVENLRKSSAYYGSWGDVSNVAFDDWWKEKRTLFGETNIREIRSIPNSANILNLSIPLNQPVTKTLAVVKEMVEARQMQRLHELGIDPKPLKSLHAGFGGYSITHGVEIRGRTLYEIQLTYGFWQDLGKPPVNTETVDEIVGRFRSRPKSKWVPYIFQAKAMPDKKGKLKYDEGQLRQIRRYLAKGKAVCTSVSLGEFPGRNNL